MEKPFGVCVPLFIHSRHQGGFRELLRLCRRMNRAETPDLREFTAECSRERPSVFGNERRRKRPRLAGSAEH